MRDLTKHILQRAGYSRSSLPASVLPEGVVEDTCPLCGKYGPLDKGGYCGTPECREAARNRAREIAREKGANVPGLYYKWGDLEVVHMRKLERWKEPQAVKDPDMCQSGDCQHYALPADYLCRNHRLEENHREHMERKKARRKGKRYTGSKQLRGNKIRGLDKIKL